MKNASLMLFELKESAVNVSITGKVNYCSCVIYRGDCSCAQNSDGETVRNTEIRWNEHENKNSKSEPAKHLKENPNHKFTWTIIRKVPDNFRKRRVLEAYSIKPFVLHLISN